MEQQARKDGPLPLQTFKRLPNYYNYLKALPADEYVAAPAIARALGLNEVQVRKDLAAVSHSPGKPRLGFVAGLLVEDIGEYLGYHNREDAVLAGVGQLGRALLSYKGFDEHGVRITAAFDCDDTLIGRSFGGKKVFAMERMPSLCRRMNIHIGVITAPAAAAQSVCDAMVKSGIRAIWNFAPIHLATPEGVLVQNENMAASLALLSQHLADRHGGSTE